MWSVSVYSIRQHTVIYVQLTSITERMIRSVDFDVNGFLREIDHSLEASRDIFNNFDNMLRFISDEDWEEIQLKVLHILYFLIIHIFFTVA